MWTEGVIVPFQKKGDTLKLKFIKYWFKLTKPGKDDITTHV
jgi:hypothetical protein